MMEWRKETRPLPRARSVTVACRVVVAGLPRLDFSHLKGPIFRRRVIDRARKVAEDKEWNGPDMLETTTTTHPTPSLARVVDICIAPSPQASRRQPPAVQYIELFFKVPLQ